MIPNHHHHHRLLGAPFMPERRIATLCGWFQRTMGKWLPALRRSPFVLHRSLFTILLLASVLAAGCAGRNEPMIPPVETYLPPAAPATGQMGAAPAKEQSAAAGETARPQPLSLASAYRIALAQNPLELVAREGIVMAEEQVGVARAPYYPELGLEAGYSRWQKHAFLPDGLLEVREDIPSVIGPTDDWSAGLSAGYVLFDSGNRQAQLRAALAMQGVAEEDAEAIRQDILLNVAKAYYNLAAGLENLKVQKENLQRAEDNLRLAEERLVVGAVPQADVLRARTEVSNSRLALVRAEHGVRVSRGELNTSMGLPVELALEIDATLSEVTSPTAIDLDQGFERAVHTRPEVKSALRSIAAARYEVDGARSAFGPKLKAAGGFGWRDADFLPEDEEWLVGVAVELPIFTGFSRVHQLSKARAQAAQEEAKTRDLVLKVRREVWNSHSRLLEAFEGIHAARTEVADAAESLRLTRERYRVGVSVITDLLDAQTALARAEADLVAAQWSYHIAMTEFERATGALAAKAQ
ncbi:TolC family protein [Desulfoferrobacter suflitae]|uniref:TolC family protein n=1 Tax=Desulfoferrobacter suflitae TaxID=2865782 RepID=UPI00216468EA|nr:TolC family protein [Desulfoferrobacter suflitae]MCK8604291.1 TolC family protein [Desulfoferrobacter suflitae]